MKNNKPPAKLALLVFFKTKNNRLLAYHAQPVFTKMKPRNQTVKHVVPVRTVFLAPPAVTITPQLALKALTQVEQRLCALFAKKESLTVKKDKLHVSFVNQVDIKIRTDNQNAKKIAMLDRTLMLDRLHALLVNKVNTRIKIGSQHVKMIAMMMDRILTVINLIVSQN